MRAQPRGLEALIRQFTPQTLLTKYTELASAGQDMVPSDIPQAMIGSLSNLALKTRQLPITNLELVPPQVGTGDPGYAAIHAMVQSAPAGRLDGAQRRAERASALTSPTRAEQRITALRAAATRLGQPLPM